MNRVGSSGFVSGTVVIKRALASIAGAFSVAASLGGVAPVVLVETLFVSSQM
jgi:hypothetical protein